MPSRKSIELSQGLIKWCVESAIELIYNACEKAGERIKGDELNQYFRNQLDNSGIDNKAISKVAYELKRNNYLTTEGDSVKLTNKAKIKIIDRFTQNKKPDGKRRLVSFDIPEVKRSQRNAFRRSIKKLGFHQIQKSLWVCNTNVGEMVEMAAKEYDVEEYVAYFVVESSNIDKHINKILF